MADILTLQAQAREAQLLLEYPAFRRVYDRLSQAALEALQHSAPEQTVVREEAYWTLRTLQTFEAELRGATKALDLETRRQTRRG